MAQKHCLAKPSLHHQLTFRGSTWFALALVIALPAVRAKDIVDKPAEFFYSLDEHSLYVWLHGGGDPNKHEIRAPFGCRTCLIAVGNKSYFVIRRLILRGGAGAAIYTNHVDHFRLEECTISYMGGQLSLGSDAAIRNCHFHHGFYNVAQGTGEGFMFEGNEVDHMGASDTWGYGIIGGETYGLNLSSFHHHVVRYNYFHDNALAGAMAAAGLCLRPGAAEKASHSGSERITRYSRRTCSRTAAMHCSSAAGTPRTII